MKRKFGKEDVELSIEDDVKEWMITLDDTFDIVNEE